MISRFLVYGIKRVKDSRIVYVGKSDTYLSMPYSHLTGSDNDQLEKMLQECNKEVEIIVFEECRSDEEALRRESWWIERCAAQGHPLANKGGNYERISTSRNEGNEIGETVAKARMELGYTQHEFSQRVGVGIRFLKELELGKPSARLDKIEQVLNFIGYTLKPCKIEYE